MLHAHIFINTLNKLGNIYNIAILVFPHYCLIFFADDLKMFHVVKSVEDCKLLKSEIDSVQLWWFEDLMKINMLEINIISFACTTAYVLITTWMLYPIQTDRGKDSHKLHIHHVGYL
jgi:hypothetical protein